MLHTPTATEIVSSARTLEQLVSDRSIAAVKSVDAAYAEMLGPNVSRLAVSMTRSWEGGADPRTAFADTVITKTRELLSPLLDTLVSAPSDEMTGVAAAASDTIHRAQNLFEALGDDVAEGTGFPHAAQTIRGLASVLDYYGRLAEPKECDVDNVRLAVRNVATALAARPWQSHPGGSVGSQPDTAPELVLLRLPEVSRMAVETERPSRSVPDDDRHPYLGGPTR